MNFSVTSHQKSESKCSYWCAKNRTFSLISFGHIIPKVDWKNFKCLFWRCSWAVPRLVLGVVFCMLLWFHLVKLQWRCFVKEKRVIWKTHWHCEIWITVQSASCFDIYYKKLGNLPGTQTVSNFWKSSFSVISTWQSI